VDAGPLPAVADDARQILCARAAPHLLRVVELQVLRAAAELLTESEARQGLTAVLALLDAGGPADLPGQRQLLVMRRSSAWSAAAALSNVCGAATSVAELLLTEAQEPHGNDQLFDTEVRRAMSELEWDQIDAGVRDQWIIARPKLADRLPGTTELVSIRANVPVTPATRFSPLDLLIHELNRSIVQKTAYPRITDAELATLREGMARIRSDAAGGKYSFGGPNEADVAAVMVIAGRADGIWRELTDFLLDPRVSRDDRSPAFDRLAIAEIMLPEDVAGDVTDRIRRVILDSSSVHFQGGPVPYPAALRFAAVHGLLDEADIFEFTARLLGDTDANARREGARTVALLAARQPADGLLTMVLPFTEDENIEVRATTGLALVEFARHHGPLRRLAVERVSELLDADGTLIPLAVLSALARAPELIAPEGPFAHFVDRLCEHPARSVRRKAAAARSQH
jgi:hypothetical protein